MGELYLKRIRVTGNTIVTNDEISAITASYIDRSITSIDLFNLKNSLTKLYDDRGYVTSGALILDQSVKDGQIEIRIVEGKLDTIEIDTDGRLNPRYVEKRIERYLKDPLNVQDLEKPLRLMQIDPLIQTINAELAPGLGIGESILHVNVKEATPYHLNLGFNNFRSPSIGGLRGEVSVAYQNLSGWGESFGGSYGFTEGLDDYSTFFSIPINRYDTRLSLSYDANDSTVITKDFEDLDIDSETDTYQVSLSHPFIRTQTTDLSLTVSLDKKKSETFILGERFSFSPGVDRGTSRVTTFGTGIDYINRSRNRVNAFRSTVNIGIDWLDATINTKTADGEFVTWLSQYQGIFRLPIFQGNNELLIRSTLRLSDDDLLPLEKFVIGGHDTVRGYRENELTRDNGFLFSVEYRIPIGLIKLKGVSQTPLDGQIQLGIFTDYGYGWNVGGQTVKPRDIASVGAGLRWLPGEKFYAELYWGHALRNITGDDEHDIQDDGIHFQVGAKVF